MIGRPKIPAPRLLPVTIGLMVALLAVKATGLVRAATPPAPEPATHSAPPPATAPAIAAMPPPLVSGSVAIPAPDKSPEIADAERSLLLDLRHRRAELDAREAGLASREAVLAATEKRLGGRMAELGTLQARLESLEQARKTRDEQNWQGLVKLYEQMKPRDAAAIFNDLDKSVLLAVLDRMKEAKAAAVLAAMLPDRARQATADLAHMRTRNTTTTPTTTPPTDAG